MKTSNAGGLKTFLLPSLGVFALLARLPLPGLPDASADDILARSRAVYASLKSYSDAGTVVNEFGTSSKEQHAFTTSFRRAPRGFHFEFRKASGDRFVIWGDPDAFHTWWQTTHVKQDYPNPNNISAFTMADPLTLGSALKIPPLLYGNASFQGAFTNFADAVNEGTEAVDGHACYRLSGTARDTYAITGRETNVRTMTVWIDAESLLIRKVVEVPKDVLPGQIARVTTTFQPQANPKLDDARFTFTPR